MGVQDEEALGLFAPALAYLSTGDAGNNRGPKTGKSVREGGDVAMAHRPVMVKTSISGLEAKRAHHI